MYASCRDVRGSGGRRRRRADGAAASPATRPRRLRRTLAAPSGLDHRRRPVRRGAAVGPPPGLLPARRGGPVRRPDRGRPPESYRGLRWRPASPSCARAWAQRRLVSRREWRPPVTRTGGRWPEASRCPLPVLSDGSSAAGWHGAGAMQWRLRSSLASLAPVLAVPTGRPLHPPVSARACPLPRNRRPRTRRKQ